MSEKILNIGSEADIAIRAKQPADNSLFGRKIADAPWALYASRSYVQRFGSVKTAEDIDRHSVVTFAGVLTDHHAAHWLSKIAPTARVAARADSIGAVLLSVKSGAGLAPMPVIVGNDEPELVRLMDLGPEMATPFYLLMHQDMRDTPRVRALFDFVIEQLDEIRPLLAPI